MGNRDRVLDRLKCLYYENHEKFAEKRAERYAKNREKAILYSAQWKRQNKDKVSASFRKNRLKNLHKYEEKEHHRRAKKRAAGGTFTHDDILEIKLMQKSKCAYCRASIRGGYHIDHIMPLAKGGSNSRSNLQLLCAPCNLRKQAQHPIVYARKIGLLL